MTRDWSFRLPWQWALIFTPALLAAGPPRAPLSEVGLVLDCYVEQSGRLGLGQFVRHLQVDPEHGVVSIADGIRGGAPRFVGNGRLITLDTARLVFDFASTASAGRTEIDRRSGAFHYQDGRILITGTCQPSTL